MALTPLLPIRHRQGDFFIAEIFDNLPYKDDMGSMEHPLFTLSLKPDMRILRYQNGAASIEMQPSAFGLPNIMDKDVLLYCASIIMAKINEGEIPPQTMRLSLHDLLVATNRHTNDRGYKYLKLSLNRLAGCLLKTSIKTGRVEQGEMFHLIERVKYLESTRVKGRILGVEVMLSDWFYNSLIAKEVLTIDKEYFRLRKPLERRIYEIARKHCGRKRRPWPIGLDKLHLKSGSTARLNHFRDTVKKLAKSDHLPEYSLNFDTTKDLVTFLYRGNAVDFEEEQFDLFGEVAAAQPPLHAPPDLLDDARIAVGPLFDYYDLWKQYRAWEGSSKARDMRAGFIGFCKQKIAKS